MTVQRKPKDPATGNGSARLTRVDERAIAKLLADSDQRQVNELMCSITTYEHRVTEAKARLTRKSITTKAEQCWHGGYSNAMSQIAAVIVEMLGAGHSAEGTVLAALAVALGNERLYYAEGVPPSWCGEAA